MYGGPVCSRRMGRVGRVGGEDARVKCRDGADSGDQIGEGYDAYGVNVFFFSSRRRHTRWTGDWSSDVCSSDLKHPGIGEANREESRLIEARKLAERALSKADARPHVGFGMLAHSPAAGLGWMAERSEERRVGKECRSRWSAYPEKKKKRRPKQE